MTMEVSQLVASLAASEIREIGKLAEGRPGVLKLQFGESSLPTPELIKAAGAKALADGFTFYTANAGYLELREAIAEKARELHGVSLRPDEQIIVTAGGVMAIYLAVHCLVNPGDEVVVVSPAWPNICAIVASARAVAVEVPLSFDGRRYRLDLDALDRAVTPRTRAIFVNSPANPTGWMLSAAERTALRDLVCRRDVVLIADEVYERIVFDGPVAPSMSRFSELGGRLVVINSFSKAYSMTGWRVGYATGPAELIAAMAKLQEFVVSHAPSVSQRAAIAALRQGEGLVAEARQKYRRLRDIACEELAAVDGAAFAVPDGTFYLFVHLPGMADSFGFARDLVVSRGVALAPGSAFGAGGEGAVRICFAVEEDILTEALARLKTALAAGGGEANRRTEGN